MRDKEACGSDAFFADAVNAKTLSELKEIYQKGLDAGINISKLRVQGNPVLGVKLTQDDSPDNRKMIKFLIDNGSDVNAKDDNGNPLIFMLSDCPDRLTFFLNCTAEKGTWVDMTAKDRSRDTFCIKLQRIFLPLIRV